MSASDSGDASLPQRRGVMILRTGATPLDATPAECAQPRPPAGRPLLRSACGAADEMLKMQLCQDVLEVNKRTDLSRSEKERAIHALYRCASKRTTGGLVATSCCVPVARKSGEGARPQIKRKNPALNCCHDCSSATPSVEPPNGAAHSTDGEDDGGRNDDESGARDHPVDEAPVHGVDCAIGVNAKEQHDADRRLLVGRGSRGPASPPSLAPRACECSSPKRRHVMRDPDVLKSASVVTSSSAARSPYGASFASDSSDDDDDGDDDDDDAEEGEDSEAGVSDDEEVAGADSGRSVLPLDSNDFPGRDAPCCEHYERKCWIKAACCGKYYPCRRCHDEAEQHAIDRHATEFVACSACGTKDQPVGRNCRDCGTEFAAYFCAICRFYDDASGKDIYHCEQCGICRQGKGVGIDNHHCGGCNSCVPLDVADTHPCIERSMDCNCPICSEHLATSVEQVVLMRCGHAMHALCFEQHTASRYTCPICFKSLTDMNQWYQALDRRLAEEVLPPEYAKKRSRILCNDCGAKTVTKFHFSFHKCQSCGAYNTRVLSHHWNEDRAEQKRPEWAS